MTSTPTPEPGERVWRCLLDGSCTATSTDDIGYHVACGWVTLPAPSTPGEGAGRPLPEFQMVACADHMLTGHRWRCRACRREVERQFQECCEEMWRLQRTTPAPPASPVPPTPTPQADGPRIWVDSEGDLIVGESAGPTIGHRLGRTMVVYRDYGITDDEAIAALTRPAPPSTPADPHPTDLTGSEA